MNVSYGCVRPLLRVWWYCENRKSDIFLKVKINQMHRRIISIVFMLCIVRCSVYGEVAGKNYSVAVLNSDCGLSQHDCECILQDKLGFIWIGTYDGLNRFDGKTVKTFRHNPSCMNSIDDNRIVALAEWPERDELWIGTDGGISRYNMRTGEFVPTGNHPELNDNYISCFLKDGDTMWVGTPAGLLRISIPDHDDISVEQFPMFDGPRKTAPYITAVECDGSGNVYAANFAEMYLKAADSNMFVKVMRYDHKIRQIYTDRRGQVWIVTNRDIYIYDPVLSSCNSPVSMLDVVGENEHLCRILEVSNNLYLLLASRTMYWISSANGKYSIEQVCFNDDSFWKDNIMKTMLIDNALNVWITSACDGVARFDLNAKAISHYDHKSGSDKTYIQKIFVDKRKRMWIATNEGVRVIDQPGGNSVPVNSISEGVYDIYEDIGGIWISSVAHIYYVPDGEPGGIVDIHTLPGFTETGITILGPYAITGNGDGTLWIGMRNGILKIRKKDDSFSFALNEVVSAQPIQEFCNITSMHYQNSGNEQSMFIGTKNVGLLRCGVAANGDLINPVAVRQLFPECGNHVWSIVKVASGRIYVGTDCGLRELSTDTDGQRVLMTVSSDERVNTYKVMSIIEDGKNNLWLNTSQGLLKYSSDREVAELIQASDGLASNILCEGAWYDSECNMLYVGGIKGIDVLDLSSLQPNNVMARTQITGIEINSIPVRPGAEFNGRVILSETPEYTDILDLEYYENNFSIDFASMHFSNPDKNTYVYTLEGFDDNWTSVDNNIHSATFTNVPPGRYVFKVKSANCDGMLSADERRLTIDIGTPVYQSWCAILFYILSGMVIVYAVVRYFLSRQKKKREDLMSQMNHKAEMEIAEAKINYNTNITHELRTPLSLIISPLDELLSRDYADEFLKTRLKLIKANADSLLLLISQFLDFRKVVNEKMILKIRRERLSELLSGIVKSFAVTAEHKGIALELCDDLSPDICWCDRDIIKKICSNLLANAIKYSPQGCHVILHAGMTPTNHVQISVEDNGIGISEKDCEKIFDRFYQVPGTIGGTGIGLNLCKSLAQLHKGTIEVISHEGEGSIFTFTFPASEDEYSGDIVDDSLQVAPCFREYGYDIVPEKAEISDKKVILVIEDNVELRNYIVQLLSADYRVISASNGQEGLTMTIDHIPDIVVCDIMMPIMDGIEYTKKVRQDIRTSHIPIILLTAKVAVESEIEGLSYGADDYVMKPFNPQVLKLRIDNLLKLTSAKARNASKEESGDTMVPGLNERERNFVETLRQLVTDNMSVPGYGMDDICTAMGMSRMQLHRKVTAILNQKPSQFIKDVKMKRAYSLLKEKGLNITETMYEVGYSNYSYFSKLFVEVHGISPRELLGMKTKSDGRRT